MFSTKLYASPAIAMAFLSLTTVACAQSQLSDISSGVKTDQTPDIDLSREHEGRRAELLSAFFGLDDDGRLKRAARRSCNISDATDGMPVIFSEELDPTTIEAGDIRIELSSGDLGDVTCVTLGPALEPGEHRTLLTLGDFGDAVENPPVRVEIVGNLHDKTGNLNFRGASIAVTPLVAGPSLVLAHPVPQGTWKTDNKTQTNWRKQANCPEDGLKQIIRTVWDGGVRPIPEQTQDTSLADLYSVTLEQADGTQLTINPFSVGNLADRDNNHELCLDVEGHPVRVAFPGGYLVDPNDDKNDDTSVEITR